MSAEKSLSVCEGSCGSTTKEVADCIHFEAMVRITEDQQGKGEENA